MDNALLSSIREAVEGALGVDASGVLTLLDSIEKRRIYDKEHYERLKHILPVCYEPSVQTVYNFMRKRNFYKPSAWLYFTVEGP